MHPDFDQAAQIMAIQARREGCNLDVDGDAEALEAAGDILSGRQLVLLLLLLLLLQSARVHAREHGRSRVARGGVAWSITDALERIGEERMALLAVATTSYNRHLPWNAIRYLGNAHARPAEVPRTVRLRRWHDRPVGAADPDSGHGTASLLTTQAWLRKADEQFADLHSGRSSLLLPSASYGIAPPS
jgi:hypothetical protein